MIIPSGETAHDPNLSKCLGEIQSHLDDTAPCGWEASDYEILTHYAPAMLAALRDVLDLHKPLQDTFYRSNEDGSLIPVCAACRPANSPMQTWPCATVTTIADELGVTA